MRNLGAPVVAVLVNWNGASDTLETLDSLSESDSPPRILLVDNGSTDDSVARLRESWPDLEILETGENLGFAGGNLAGIRRALEDPEVGFVLLINTDVEVAPDFLEPLVVACADPDVGAAGPKIFYADPRDRLWAAGGRLRLRETVTEEWGRGERDGPKWCTPKDVTYLTTCCLLIPRDALENVGPLDPAYFINVDDADWCRRALDAGYRLRYEPASVLWHKVASSTAGSYTPFKTFHTGRSNAIYVRKHHGFFGRLVFVGWNLLALAAAFLREAPKGNARAVWGKVRGAWEGLRSSLPTNPSL
ncbi:MAG: glycosyltransferase family 2 protein [Acidobacteriota bacterium]